LSENLVRSREAVRKTGGATKYLLALSVLLMFALAAAFTHLSNRQNALQDSIREDALWAVYQFDRESRTLFQTLTSYLSLSRPARDDVNALTLRYDILYSRLSILANGKYEAYFEQSEHVIALRPRARELVLAMEPAFNAMAAGKDVSRKSLDAAATGLRELLDVTEDLLTFTNSTVSAARSDAREEIMHLQKLSAWVVLALGISIALLILNLMRQLRIVRAATDEIEATANKMADAYKAAEAGNQAKSQFMATIGHEIRTPLNAILGMAELLSMGRLGEEERENVRVITSSGTALLEIINEILDFAKIEHGDEPPENVPFHAPELVRQAMNVMEGRAREQRDRLELVMNGMAGRGWYLGDPNRLRRVLLNLLSNAVKFTEGGTVRVSLSEIHRNGASRLLFEVVDTGIGIPEDSRHRLFNAFSQVDGTISRRFGGTGLGLAICKRIVEGLDGRIGFDSEAGEGSRFWFEIPVSAIAAPAPAQSRDDAATLPRLEVLLVEDNAVNREVASQFLRKLGQDVGIAVDGAQAVRLAAERDFDLILMDMQMPVMDGIAATKAIRELPGKARTVPIVAMTANASDSDRRRCVEAGMTGFQSKPISMAQLASIVANHAPAEARDRVSLAMPAAAQPARPAPAAPREPDLDRERVAEMIEAIGEDGFRHLVDVFFADAGALLADLGRAMADSDAELGDRTLHSLKGSASNLGFMSLAALAESLRKERLDATAAARIAAELARLSESRVADAA